MSAEQLHWPDPDHLLVQAIQAHLDATYPGWVRVATSTPDTLDRHHFVRVYTTGGESYSRASESVSFRAESFAPSYPEAMTLAQAVRRYVLYILPGTDPGGLGLVDAVSDEVRPHRAYYRNRAVCRVDAVYSMDQRLQPL